jgi:hypothetical protein
MSDMDGFEVQPEDLRKVLLLIKDNQLEDIHPDEQAALVRLTQALDHHDEELAQAFAQSLVEHERHIAQHTWKNGLTTDDGEPYMIGVNVPTQDEIAEAQVVTWDQLLVTETVDLRRDVKAAYDEWQSDIDNARLEEAYRDKLTDLDRNLEERGLERGESLDQELPMQSLDQSLDRGHDRGR